MPHPTADSSWFTFEAPADNAFRVFAFTGIEEAHRPYEFEIELVDESSGVDFTELLGQPACLSVADKSGGIRHVHGVIRHFTQLHTSNLRTHYRCLLVPRLWFLGLVADQRIFQNMSVLQIIEQILKEQNFTGDSYAFKCFFDYAPREYCVQYGETSLHFISRLCEEEGVYFYFEHSADRHVLCFSDREGGPAIGGESGLRFHPGAGTETDTTVVREVELNQAIVSDAFTFREWNFEKTRLDLQVGQAETDSVKAPVPAGMTLERYRHPHLYQLQKDGRRYADMELLRHFSLSRWIDARADASRMLPGHVFELFGHRRPELNARWWVVRVEHRGEQPQVLEHEAPDRGMTYAADVRAIPFTTRFVPASDHPKTRIPEKQTAIVTGPEGEEIFPDRYGRVKVQFHWDRLGGYDENTTCWIRVAQGWAGGQYGTMAIPRIGHEVVVSFLEGDPDRPVVTGRVFNSANPVPYFLPEHKTRTVFKSLSSPGGEGFNELRVEDRKGQEEIFVHAEKDVNVHVKNDWKEHVLRDQHRTIDHFSYSLVKGEDQQTVEKDRKVELLSDDHLTVRGSSHSRYGNDWLLHAGTESHVAAGRKTVIEAGSELTIKAGGGFIRIDPSGVYVGGTTVRINSGGSPGVGSGAAPQQPGTETNVAMECSSDDGPAQHMGSMGSLLPGTGDPVPAIVTSEEEICRVIIAVKGSEAIQAGLSQVMELTRDNGVEYSGWILKDGPGQYSLSVIKKGEAMSVIPNPKPVNAIGNFHTHVSSSARPSGEDVAFAAYATDKCLFYMIISAHNDYYYINGNGDPIFCDN